MSELTISVSIAERAYKLVIDLQHETLFREAAKLIEKRMRDYSGSYTYKDKQDLLAMVALEYATSYLQEERNSSGQNVEQMQKLAKIDLLLTEYLAQ
ncbi:MAG: cell division protein ZapA [bacterium]